MRVIGLYLIVMIGVTNSQSIEVDTTTMGTDEIYARGAIVYHLRYKLHALNDNNITSSQVSNMFYFVGYTKGTYHLLIESMQISEDVPIVEINRVLASIAESIVTKKIPPGYPPTIIIVDHISELVRTDVLRMLDPSNTDN